MGSRSGCSHDCRSRRGRRREVRPLRPLFANLGPIKPGARLLIGESGVGWHTGFVHHSNVIRDGVVVREEISVGRSPLCATQSMGARGIGDVVGMGVHWSHILPGGAPHVRVVRCSRVDCGDHTELFPSYPLWVTITRGEERTHSRIHTLNIAKTTQKSMLTTQLHTYSIYIFNYSSTTL